MEVTVSFLGRDAATVANHPQDRSRGYKPCKERYRIELAGAIFHELSYAPRVSCANTRLGFDKRLKAQTMLKPDSPD
jgi:hypothetical protein